MAGRKKLTRLQNIFIGGFVLILVLLLVVMAAIIWPTLSSVIFPPTARPVVALATNTEEFFLYAALSAQPTLTMRPPPTMRAKKPTWTPYSTDTFLPLPTLAPTKTLGPSPTYAQAQIPNSKPDCSAQYNYIAAVHQYYLDYYNSYYNQWIAYYKSLENQAVAERDAGWLLQLQGQIKSLKSQRDAAINSENSRYEAQVAYYNSICR